MIYTVYIYIYMYIYICIYICIYNIFHDISKLLRMVKSAVARRCNAETAWAVASREMSRCPRRRTFFQRCADGLPGWVTLGLTFNVAKCLFKTPSKMGKSA